MLYNIYTTHGNAPMGITDWEHLRVMRLDFTERQIYNHRYIPFDKNIKHLFKPRDSHATLKRIGFVSRDFHDCRPNGQLAIRFFNILSKYKKQFTLHFFSLVGHPIADKFHTFGTVKTAPEFDQLAQIIANDSIDILIDMQGYMVHNFTRLLLQKPAPIQMHWLGYPGTLGNSAVDYLVGDDIIIPDNSQKYYREKIAYMPHLYQSNNPDFIQRDNYVTRGFYEIKESTFVFTHFNSDYKLDRNLWFVWMDILKAVPDSLLVFTILTSNEDDVFIKQLYADAELAGVRDKVMYMPKTSRHQHFNRLQLFNLGLDTYRINGHTTSADLVCAGVPFITCPSDTYHNRVAHSILHELEIDDLVCENFEAYKNKAIELATNKEYYLSVKQKIIDNREKVMFNTHHYTRSFVNMIYSIWDEYHIRDEERKQLTHLFLNKETNDIEEKDVPFVKTRLGKFNNHYIGKPTTKWVFYPNKNNSKLFKPIIISKKRKQYLRDFANTQDKCVAFNTEGELFNCIDKKLVDLENTEIKYGEEQGIWLREPIPEDEQEKDISLTLNKDYKLPKICLVFKNSEKTNPSQSVPALVSYLFNQRYLNTELIVLSLAGPLPGDGKKFVHEHINFVKYIDLKSENKPIEQVLQENTKSEIILEISQEALKDKFFVQKFYEEKILKK